MVTLKVSEADIELAKKQIAAFEGTESGSWRYKDVEAWRGIVCEMLVSKWLEDKFNVSTGAKGLDTSGNADDYDLIINGKKVEVKSATKNYFRSIMPKIHDIIAKPKDIYIGAKYNETVEPNEVDVLGYIERAKILNYPVEQNKGAPYYNIPLADLKAISPTTFD